MIANITYIRIVNINISNIAPATVITDYNAFFRHAISNVNRISAGGIAAKEAGHQNFRTGFYSNIFNVNRSCFFRELSIIVSVCAIIYYIFSHKTIAHNVTALYIKVLYSRVTNIFKQAFSSVRYRKGIAVTVYNSRKRKQALAIIRFFSTFFKPSDRFPINRKRNIVSKRNSLSDKVVRLSILALYHTFYILELFLIMYKERVCSGTGAFKFNKIAHFIECNCNGFACACS